VDWFELVQYIVQLLGFLNPVSSRFTTGKSMDRIRQDSEVRELMNMVSDCLSVT